MKTFFIDCIGTTSMIGTLASVAMFLNAMSNSDMHTGIVWFLITAVCLAVLLTILNAGDD